jgi:class 3 adenylate cyclase
LKIVLESLAPAGGILIGSETYERLPAGTFALPA